MMNLKQLAKVEDSLRFEVTENYSALRRSVSTSVPEVRLIPRSRRTSAQSLPDSLKNDSIAIPVHIDSIFSRFDTQRKDWALNQAINSARNTISLINNTFVTADSKIRRLRKYEIETQRKFTLSLACLIFFFIGAPLGAIIRKGGLGMPVVVSVLFFILYYIISLMGEKMVRESVISAGLGMWISSYILIPLSIFLTYKASTDSVIMNTDTYLNLFKKLFLFWSRKKRISDKPEG